MSLLSKLNPLKWIKDALVSDYIGGQVRHLLSLLGGLLIGWKLGSPELVGDWVHKTTELVTSDQFLQGIGLIFTSLGASVWNKRAQ